MAYIQLLRITPFGQGTLGLAALCVWMTMQIFKRKEMKPGCLGFGYVFLVVFLLSSLSLGLSYVFATYVFEKADLLLHCQKYKAKIVDFETRESTDSEEGTTTNYYPVLKFTTNKGQTIQRTSDESDMSEKHIIGEERNVYYNAKKDKLTTIGAMTFVAFFGMLIMFLVSGLATLGIALYSFGYQMDWFRRLCINLGTIFILPLVMIAFDALLIYALFYGNTEQAPWIIIPLLSIFIFVLTLGIFGYLKMIIAKGAPKFRQVSPTEWEGDWDDDNEDDESINGLTDLHSSDNQDRR